MTLICKEVAINQIYQKMPSMPIFRRENWRHKNEQYLDCVRILEDIPEYKPNISKLIDRMEAQIKRDYAYAEHETGAAKARREGIANGLQVAVDMVMRFYVEECCEIAEQGQLETPRR